jgi:chemotaxis protein CheZ
MGQVTARMTFETDDVRILKRELVGMFGHIQRIRRELASIRTPGHEEDDHFAKMSDQLDAIVESTEDATNSIMSNAEEIEDLVGKAKARISDGETNLLLDQVSDRVNAMFEACSFQDLTGQRVTKVVRSLKFVEERVNTLIRMWGREELAKVVVEMQDTDPDKALLNGPQRKGEGVTQEDVDAMFSDAPPKLEFDQNDIDKLFG